MILMKRAPLLAAALACALLAGCSQDKEAATNPPAAAPNSAPGSPATPPTPADGQTMLAFVTNNPSDYWTICRKGTEAAAKDLGNVNVQFVMPADGTAATQKQDVDDLLSKGVKGIAISPVDPANETPDINKWPPRPI